MTGASTPPTGVGCSLASTNSFPMSHQDRNQHPSDLPVTVLNSGYEAAKVGSFLQDISGLCQPAATLDYAPLGTRPKEYLEPCVASVPLPFHGSGKLVSQA